MEAKTKFKVTVNSYRYTLEVENNQTRKIMIVRRGALQLAAGQEHTYRLTIFGKGKVVYKLEITGPRNEYPSPHTGTASIDRNFITIMGTFIA